MAEFDTLTAMGDVPGTLGYISPERLLGKPATTAADIWAVGVMLWEALAGRASVPRTAASNETSRRIQSGAPPLETVRPDLPQALCKAVASALALNPARRPEAGVLAEELRSLAKKRRRAQGREQRRGESRGSARAQRSLRSLPRRALPAGACALATGWVASTLPFYPAQWPLGLAAVAAALGFAAPRAGLAFALAVAFFPLANISLGLGDPLRGARGRLARARLERRPGRAARARRAAARAARRARPRSARGAGRARAPAARACRPAPPCCSPPLVAGLRHERLPFDGSVPPLGLGIAGSEQPGRRRATRSGRRCSPIPALLAETAVFAAAAALLPSVRGRGPWPRRAVRGRVPRRRRRRRARRRRCCRSSAPPGSPPRRSPSKPADIRLDGAG